MTQSFLYLNLANAATGQINGVVDSNSANSIVVSETMIAVSPNFLAGTDRRTIDKTHYYKEGQLLAYPPCPQGPANFDFTEMKWVEDTDLAWELVRLERDQRIKGSDWLVTKAVELGEPMPAGWAAYRQALRDITQQSDPNNINWPVEPT